jgi:thiosulfate dehydrogenase [quinone] large subunit
MIQYEAKLSPFNEYTLAFLTLRFWLGVRAVVTGLEKYGKTILTEQPLIDPATGQPDVSGAMVEVSAKAYGLTNYAAIPDSLKDKFAAEPLMPAAMTSPFYAVLGPVLIVLGVTTLLGIAPRFSLFFMGLLYTALTVGLILIKQDDGVSWLAIHVALIAFALTLAQHNRFALWPKH